MCGAVFFSCDFFDLCSCVVRFSFHVIFCYVFMCGAIFFSCDFLICVHVWCGFLFMCFFDMCSCVVPFSFHVIF